jgi:3',5'-cyclic AMP phosphodiesterase CpdA/uncharacterized membrane protein HdeD (DUF308 family)
MGETGRRRWYLEPAKWNGGTALAVLVLAVLALATPLAGVDVAFRVGVILILAAVLEVAHGFRRSTAAAQRAAWAGGVITLAMGVLLVNAPYLASSAVLIGFAGWYGLDAARAFGSAVLRRDERRSAGAWALAGAGNLLMCAVLVALRERAAPWVLAVAGALRLFGTATNIAWAPVFSSAESGARVVSDHDLPDEPELHELADRLAKEESARAAVDRGWVIGFIVTLFAIHVGRMGFDRTALGVMAPGVAVLGDVFVALVVAFVAVIPAGLAWRRLTRPVERRAWAWCLGVPAGAAGWGRRLVRAGLTRRLRAAVRLRQARYSFRAALSRGLQIGLPVAAVVAATVPVWGVSWYFDTENWASGVWNTWAAQRTDRWREAMVAAVLADDPGHTFTLRPPGVATGGDFAFIVIGDTGEGDASQHSLRAQLLEAARADGVRFVVLSSDVIYPAGAMRDYEANFWLPFMGVTKPVYAIPGNHDWFDANEGFNATFLEPRAAQLAMRARVEVDNRLTSTTERRVDQLIAEATRLRGEYRVPTQHQRGTFFQIQTDDFALIAVDTGVMRRVDPLQMRWLRDALAASRGKFTMAILGHPFFSGGHDTSAGDEEFAALRQLFREHGVAVVMAGDTHDLEYYPELVDGRTTHHFVNGGGGAYLSFGSALAWPERPVTAEWAIYPGRAAVVAKVEATARPWMRPAWWWTKKLGAWPFSAEWLSAAFDSNVAPFYQSFLVVHVEPSRRRVRLAAHGIHGPLRWSDLDRSGGVVPVGTALDAPVEWVVPMGSSVGPVSNRPG